MIGSARAIGIVGALAMGVSLCLRPGVAAAADPAAEAARAGRLAELAERAVDRVGELSAALDGAREHARRGAAFVVSGDEDPAPELVAAAVALETGAATATAAQAAMRELSGAMSALAPPPDPPDLTVSAATLLGVAAQMRSAADAATVFAERRDATVETLTQLRDALAALDAGDLDRAATKLALARSARTEVASWEAPPAELSLWLDTTGAMLGAADEILSAARAGDMTALEAAASAYRQAAAGAAVADRALALAISEGGAAVTAGALAGLVAALENVDQVSQQLAAVAAPRPGSSTAPTRL